MYQRIPKYSICKGKRVIAMTKANDHNNADYIARLEKIRRLSSPSLEGIDDAMLYSELLRKNFILIGNLSTENRAFLDTELYPILFSNEQLSAAQTDELIALSEALLSATNVENLDLPIVSLISDRLLKDAASQDDATSIRRLDMRMDACYALTLMLGRVHTCPQIADRFRQEGMAIGRRCLEFLEPAKFQALDVDSREIVLTDARYMAVFYEGVVCDSAGPNEELLLLDRMLAIADDPFYRALLPDYDWRYFRYRALNYYAKATDGGNARGFGPAELDVICDRAEDFSRLWYSDPDHFSNYDNEKQMLMLLYRNRYLAGRISYRECHDALIALYERRDPHQYDLNGIYDNLQLPFEVICQLDRDHLSPDDLRWLDLLYHEIIRYAFHMPNSGTLSSMLEFFQYIIDRFIEVPGGLSFEDMALQCLAALHPPTYVHSMMVAKLSSYLCEQLIERDPKWLVGTPGCESVEDVVANRSTLTDFTFHAARCHDVGKLSIIDTIFVYGRNLFDTEFELIRTHPRTGYELLDRHDSTRPYRDVALGHHRWYDNSRGYPEDFDTRHSPVKPIIDIVLCADCLDAATDSVGRSYRRGKTLDDFINEVLPECGAHYPPWLAELLKDPETAQGLRAILQEGRRETYQSTYSLLSRMNEA